MPMCLIKVVTRVQALDFEKKDFVAFCTFIGANKA